MHTNLYLAEKLPTARQRELLAEAERDRLLATLANHRQPWLRYAARHFWALLSALGAGQERTAHGPDDGQINVRSSTM
jgi:hypothetical protein